MTQESVTLSRRERERLMRREAILEAAREIFAERGYEQATLDEIAQRAEFGKGTLYNYFPGGKEELLMATLERLYDELEALAESIFREPVTTPEQLFDVFRRFIEAHLRFFETHQDIFLLLMKEAHRLMLTQKREEARLLIRQRERIIARLLPVLKEAMARGLLRQLDAHMVAHTLLGNIYGLFFAMHMQKHCSLEEIPASALSVSEAAEFLTTVLFKGMLITGKEVS